MELELLGEITIVFDEEKMSEYDAWQRLEWYLEDFKPEEYDGIWIKDFYAARITSRRLDQKTAHYEGFVEDLKIRDERSDGGA